MKHDWISRLAAPPGSSRRLAGRSSRWRMLLIAVATALAVVGTLPGGVPRVDARASHDLPSPYAFALPQATFPPGSVVRGSRATEPTLEAASSLHTVPLARLGHLIGYLQTAWWWPPARPEGAGRRQLASLQYMASIFSSSQQADAAYGDAQASLWELGAPTRGRVGDFRLFAVTERDGYGGVYVLLHQGPIELELRLRYNMSIDRRALDSGIWYLRHAVLSAWTLAQRLAPNLPSSSQPAQPNPLAAIESAPWGAGPVVKNAALMVLAADQVGSETHLDPGTFRTHKGAALALRAVQHPRIVPPRGLQHFVQTASEQGGTGWYDATTLYQGPGQAHNALLAIGHSNRYHPWLPPYRLDQAVWHVGRLTEIDESRAWTLQGESIFVFRLQNVLMVLAEIGQSPDDMVQVVDQLVATVPTWLHAQGTDIVTATGDRVRLASMNWYGAEENDFVVGGLDFQSYQAILQRIKLLGFNSLRLPVSNELVEKDPIVPRHVAANPELKGLHAMDILDRIINYAGALGISIILDDHRSDAGWSTDPSGLWYTKDYPDSAFIHDWVTLAQRYKLNNVVVGADLRNEPHGKANWSDGDLATDWHDAAERAGNAVLSANPRLLIMVEGIQYYKKAISYWWGGSLMGVAAAPVVLHFADGSSARSQLVYSVHDYGPDICGPGCPWFNKTATYASLSQIWDQYWGYVVSDPKQPYAAPIWVGEFGTCDYQRSCVTSRAPGSQGQWFNSLVRYIGEKRVSWGYWAVNGTESTGGSRVYGTLDWYGYLDHTWTTPYSWLEEELRGILEEQAVPPSSPPA